MFLIIYVFLFLFVVFVVWLIGGVLVCGSLRVL